MKVLIADDHPLIRAGVRRVLDEAEEIEVVGEAETGAEALAQVARTNPDVVLLDLRMPQMDGLTCLGQIRQRHPNIKVIMLSVFSDPAQIERALTYGAAGYVVKSVNPIDLPSAIRQAVEGTVFHAIGSSELDKSSLANDVGLTERELAILKAVARGLTNSQVGQELWITETTVKFHLSNIYRKLNVKNRTGATRWAHENGLTEALVLEPSD